MCSHTDTRQVNFPSLENTILFMGEIFGSFKIPKMSTMNKIVQ